MKKKKRSEMAKVRENIENREQKSKRIANGLIHSGLLSNANVIACFISFRSEVDTTPLIESFWALGKTVVVPKVVESMMIFYPIFPDSPYRISPLGIKEPINVSPIDHDTIDLVIVPGLAFDIKGHRLGYGGGYYDKFLSTYTATPVAVAFEKQIVDDVPYDDHDQLVHYVVTENKIVDCRE